MEKSFLLSLLTLLVAIGVPACRQAEPPPAPASQPPVFSGLDRAMGPGASALEPGDLLLSWQRPGERMQRLDSAVDWFWLCLNHVPRGKVLLTVSRQGTEQVIEISERDCRADLEPPLSGELLTAYRLARQGVRSGDRILMRAIRSNPVPCWLYLQIASPPWDARGPWLLLNARRHAFKTPISPECRLLILQAHSEAHMRRSDFDHARELLDQAAEGGGDSLARVHTHLLQGKLIWTEGRPEPAERWLLQAQEAAERTAPGSLVLAEAKHYLGNVAANQGMSRSIHHLNGALEILQREVPNSLNHAATLASLASAYQMTGELARAAQHAKQSLEIREQVAPDTLDVAKGNRMLSQIYEQLQEYGLAQHYAQRALEKLEALGHNGRELIFALKTAGRTTRLNGDPALSEDLLRQALALTRETMGESTQLAAIYNDLGDAAIHRGAFAEAEPLFREAVRIFKKVSPGSLDQATCLREQGNVLIRLGDSKRGRKLVEQALALAEAKEGSSVELGQSLYTLGQLAYEEDDRQASRQYLRRSLGSYREVGVEALEVIADSLLKLGELARRDGQLEAARNYIERSAQTAELMLYKIGRSRQLRRGNKTRHGDYLRHLVDFLLDNGLEADAFEEVERYRGQTFRYFLAEKRHSLDGDLPDDLRSQMEKVEQDRAKVLGAYYQALAHDDPARVDAVSNQLNILDGQREAVASKIRALGSGLGAAEFPPTFGARQAQETLAPGSLFLSYFVGKEETHIFIITPDRGPLPGATVPIAEGELRQRIELFRELIEKEASASSLRRQWKAQLEDHGAHLYRLLVAPVAEHLRQADRILLAPDGPLHLLPFGALQEEPGGAFLIERKPLSIVLSATLYSEIRRPGKDEPGADKTYDLVALGDPEYPGELSRPVNGATPPSRRSGGILANPAPLPHSRKEVEGIQALYGSSRSLLGGAATEEQLKSLMGSTKLLHLAAHGIVDNRFPLLSGLMLPNQDGTTGRLQADEVLEGPPLDLELVVLSACQSALGEELDGEGLIGLTSAFQYAGADSVLATLWSVADQATADLMVRFHTYLSAGEAKAEALRKAQLDLIRGSITTDERGDSHHSKNAQAPYYWAGFQLYGDWH